MTKHGSIKVFEHKRIRSVWDDEAGTWFYSVVDVVGILTDQPDTRHASVYWSVLKKRLSKESCELITICKQLKLASEDGKFRLTDVADTKGILRIIQSIPSPKAEPFKRWLAEVGEERLEEIEDPELAISRALFTYRRKGYSESWINQRLKTIEVRKELTDEWDRSGVHSGFEYASLTDIISKAWSGMTTREYKNLKGLRKENLRDNMSNLELILNMLAEASATELSKQKNPRGFEESAQIAKRGGDIAGEARKQLEAQTGIPVCTPDRGTLIEDGDDVIEQEDKES